MRYRIHQIKLNMNQTHDDLPDAIRRKLKRRHLQISHIRIVKESIDARKKPDVKLVYTLDFTCDETLPLDAPKEANYDAMMAETMERCRKMHGDARGSGDGSGQDNGVMWKRPVIVGFGPCGMFAALVLAEAGLRPIVLERGEAVEERAASVARFWGGGKLDPESNVQFGEGGAGTFSDGKLTTGVKDVRISKVLQEFVAAGAEESVLYKQKPHIGTDQLQGIVKQIRRKIESLGGEIRFNTRMDDIITTGCGGQEVLKGIRVSRGGESLETDMLVLAIGHSARDTFRMLYEKGLPMEQKAFSIGVRIQHPQEMIDRVQYGDPKVADRLGAADYKLNHRCENGRGVYTFCMCPGGEVINASSEEETAVTNGMSNHARDSKWANCGLLVDVRTTDFPSHHPLAGVDFQRTYEKLAYRNGQGSLPETTYGMFRNDETDKVRSSLPDFAAEAIIEAMPHLGRKLSGFDSEDAKMTAVETRSSSPVRILRGEDLQTPVKGIYPAGEGPGYAGGIMSAAVDGIRVAEQIITTLCIFS